MGGVEGIPSTDATLADEFRRRDEEFVGGGAVGDAVGAKVLGTRSP